VKEIIKNGFFVFLRSAVVGIMCAITTVSIFFLFTAICTEKVGYDATVTDKDGVKVTTYTHYDKDGDDTKLAEYEKQGYTVSTSTRRSQLEGKSYITYSIISEFISISILAIFIHNELFDIGNKDRNAVNFKHKKEDKLKGLKIGLIASIPSFVTYIALLAVRIIKLENIPVSYFSVLNMPVYQILKAIYGNTILINDLSFVKLILMVLPLFIIPLVSYISYTFGYKDIFLLQKIVYKDKKGANK